MDDPRVRRERARRFERVTVDAGDRMAEHVFGRDGGRIISVAVEAPRRVRELARDQAEFVRLRPGADGQIGIASDQVAAFAADFDLDRQAGQLAAVSSYPLPDLSNSRSPSASSGETVIEIACAHGFHAEELGRSGTMEFWIKEHLLFELVTAEARISSALPACRSLRIRNVALDTPLIVPEQKRPGFTAFSERLAVAVDK